MRPFLEILALGRGAKKQFLVVALLVSLGTGAKLFEPWIYRTIVDDIAGVFVAPQPLRRVEGFLEHLGRSIGHVPGSAGRIFQAPLQKQAPGAGPRTLEPRPADHAFATVLLGALLIVLIRALSQYFRLWGDNRSTSLSNEIERRFIVETFRHVLRLPLSFFSKRASGAIARQIDQSDQIAPVFNAVSHEICPDFVTLIAILVILFSVNGELAAVVLLVVPLYGWVTWRMAQRLDTQLDQYYLRWDDVSSRIQQAVSGIKTVQTYGTSHFEISQLEKATREAYDSYLQRNKLQNRYNYVQEMIMAVSKAIIVAIGGFKALQHQLTPGDVVLYLAYVDRVYKPVEGLMALYSSLQQHTTSVRRAQRLLAEPPMPGEDLPPFRPRDGEVEFEGVEFSYQQPGRRVLDGVSFRLRPGERVAVVGPSGAGKTTLTDLLVALYRPQAGDIRVDGNSLQRVRPSSVRAAIRGVAADGSLFKGSVRENIRYGRLEATDPEAEEAAQLAGLGPVLERLPEGLDTLIGERGVELSVGERQRVLLARAFLARPTILILDEATANLDFRTEGHVKEALERLSRGRTTLLIAHRKSMLTRVDRVLVLREGRIEQDGPPEVLLRQDGYFREMMSSQEV
jgi:ABC-type multidrug transport system fused ATPase/permease subunit